MRRQCADGKYVIHTYVELAKAAARNARRHVNERIEGSESRPSAYLMTISQPLTAER